MKRNVRRMVFPLAASIFLQQINSTCESWYLWIVTCAVPGTWVLTNPISLLYLQPSVTLWWLISFLKVSWSLCLNTYSCNSCWIFILCSCSFSGHGRLTTWWSLWSNPHKCVSYCTAWHKATCSSLTFGMLLQVEQFSCQYLRIYEVAVCKLDW